MTLNEKDKFFSLLVPTYLENWSVRLTSLSIPQVGIRLHANETQMLLYYNENFGKRQPVPASFNEIRYYLTQKIDQELRLFGQGAFVRLGSRSAKDSYYAQSRGLRIRTGLEALNMLTSGSERIMYDTKLALRYDYTPFIFLRQWIAIPLWSEFRCFMKNGQLIGISQYDILNLGHSPEISRNAVPIEAAIRRFFKQFQRVCPIQDIVFDVCITLSADETIPQVTLLELNPFVIDTDSCLFNWTNPADFNGEFRFL